MLDAGAGTGLCTQALQDQDFGGAIDAAGLSAPLLAVMAVMAPGAVMTVPVNLGVWKAQGFMAARAALGQSLDLAPRMGVPIHGAAMPPTWQGSF